MKKFNTSIAFLLLLFGSLGFAQLEVRAAPKCDNPQIDFACQREKLLNPNADCEVEICDGKLPPEGGGEIVDVDFFGFPIRLDSNKAIAQIIYLVFSLFLGIIALAVTFYGVRGAVARARADSDDQVASAVKMMRNAIIGLVIVGMSILVVQIIAGLLGLGSINDIARFDSLLN